MGKFLQMKFQAAIIEYALASSSTLSKLEKMNKQVHIVRSKHLMVPILLQQKFSSNVPQSLRMMELFINLF